MTEENEQKPWEISSRLKELAREARERAKNVKRPTDEEFTAELIAEAKYYRKIEDPWHFLKDSAEQLDQNQWP